MPAPSFGLDHIVVLVDDLEAAAAAYGRLGFTVAPQMRHEGFGTANRLIVFENTMLELVGVVAPAELAGPGLMIRDRLASHGPGPFGIALNAQDIARDRQKLADAGLTVGEIGGGSRPVPLPDGTRGLARFSTCLIGGPKEMPFLLFMSQQHEQSVVWIKEWQHHANGAREIAGVTIASSHPEAFEPLLQAFGGTVRKTTSGITADLPLGGVEVVSEAPPLGSEASRIVSVRLDAPGARRHIAADQAFGLVLDLGAAA